MHLTVEYPIAGGCDCQALRYQLLATPLFVNCCHCRWCQRESGSAFALNAIIETNRIELLNGEPDMIDTPSASGKGQRFARCPRCRITAWSHYASAGPSISFVRVGTLDQPDLLPPDIHVFTESRQPWVVLPTNKPVCAAYYSASDHWPQQSLERWKALSARNS